MNSSIRQQSIPWRNKLLLVNDTPSCHSVFVLFKISSNNPNTQYNRGYFPNEIVEGGSVMTQDIWIPAAAGLGPERANAYYYSPQYSSRCVPILQKLVYFIHYLSRDFLATFR